MQVRKYISYAISTRHTISRQGCIPRPSNIMHHHRHDDPCCANHNMAAFFQEHSSTSNMLRLRHSKHNLRTNTGKQIQPICAMVETCQDMVYWVMDTTPALRLPILMHISPIDGRCSCPNYWVDLIKLWHRYGRSTSYVSGTTSIVNIPIHPHGFIISYLSPLQHVGLSENRVPHSIHRLIIMFPIVHHNRRSNSCSDTSKYQLSSLSIDIRGWISLCLMLQWLFI